MTYATIHFVRFIILIAVISISFFTFAIPRTHAYFTTNQDARLLDNHTGLFTIDYVFGVRSHTIDMPVLAQNSLETSPNKVSYVILDDNDRVVPGKATALVFSTAELQRSGIYTVSKNEAKKFTLAVLFRPDTIESGMRYRLQVTHLPFMFDGTKQLQLNPSELIYYTTKGIGL